VKKLIAMLLIAGVVLTATVGCGGTPSSKAPASPSTGDKPK